MTASRCQGVQFLRRQAAAIRKHDLVMLHRARLGHPGSDLSAADILATLYFAVLRVDPHAPDDPLRDRFILSKGHAAGALYATLALAGFFPPSELETFAQPLSRLSGHPARHRLPGVEASTGPLGHGLPFAVGCALAARLDEASWRTFVLTGDGELQEGSNWEAAMAASHFGLDNLTLIIDRNGLQLGDATERTMALEPLAAREQLPLTSGRPSCLIANTHKGQGVSFMRDRLEWHHRIPDDAELEAALREIEAQDG